MRVLYDVTTLANGAEPGKGRTGIFRASQGFVDELLGRDDGSLDVTFAAIDSWYAEVLLGRYGRSAGERFRSRTRSAWEHPTTSALEAAAVVERAVAAGEDTPAGRRALTELAFLDRTARPVAVGGDFDVYHSLRPGLVGPGRVAARGRVLTVYDLIPLLFPHWFDRDHAAALTSILATLGPGDRVVVNSTCTRDDVCTHLDIEPETVSVIPLAADPAIFRPVSDPDALASVRGRYGLGAEPYVLAVATLEPRKNLAGLARAYFSLVESGEARDLRLVLVGPAGWRTDELLTLLEGRGESARRVTLTGFVPDGDLASLYSAADVFAYPSLYEGFGLPVLEAMACGVPVVVSDTPALTELTAGCARVVEPDDVEGLAAAILDARGDTDAAARGLARAATFSWARTVDATLALYESA